MKTRIETSHLGDTRNLLPETASIAARLYGWWSGASGYQLFQIVTDTCGVTTVGT